MILAGDEPIYIIRRSIVSSDDYGNPTFSQTSTLVRNCLIGFGSTGEPVDVSRDPIDSALTIYFPHGTVVEEGDVFEIRGQFWVKDGEPQVWDTIGTFEVGVVVNVRRRRG